MPKLFETLTQEPNRAQVISDCCTVINEEVASKSGLTGLAVKGAFKAVKAVKPGIIESVIDVLLEDFARQLDVIYGQYLENGGGDLERYFREHSHAVADSLLTITDRRAEKSKLKPLVKAYQKLRPQGQKHVVEAVPRIAGLLVKHGL